MFIILNDIAILIISSANYHYVINRFSKIEASNLLQKPDLNKKLVEYYKLKNWKKNLKYIKEIISDIKAEKNKFQQNKSSISITNIDINKIVVSNKVTKMVKNLKRYLYCFQIG